MCYYRYYTEGVHILGLPSRAFHKSWEVVNER
jgi:hypothetical protein